MKPYDAAVIGGGVAGPALAMELAGAGRSVVLFEKEKEAHDKVCGEFISHEGVRYLSEIGVSLEGLGSVPINHVRLARHGGAVTAELPFQAQSLSRRVLDENSFATCIRGRRRDPARHSRQGHGESQRCLGGPT